MTEAKGQAARTVVCPHRKFGEGCENYAQAGDRLSGSASGPLAGWKDTVGGGCSGYGGPDPAVVDEYYGCRTLAFRIPCAFTRCSQCRRCSCSFHWSAARRNKHCKPCTMPALAQWRTARWVRHPDRGIRTKPEFGPGDMRSSLPFL